MKTLKFANDRVDGDAVPEMGFACNDVLTVRRVVTAPVAAERYQG
jgi:hypothetical protein